MTSNRSDGTTTSVPPPATRGSVLLTRQRPLALIVALATALFLITSPLVTSQDSTPDTPGAAATPAATPPADATRLELTFAELNDSGVSGTATLYEMGDQTFVELALDGTGDNHPAHIHAGTCDTIQPEAAFNLNNVGPDGTSNTLVDVSLAELLNDEHVIDLHLAPDQLGLLVTCAEITGTPVNAEGTPVSVGGEATETPPSTEPVATETAEATSTTDTTTTATETAEPTTTTEPTATEAATATSAPDGIPVATEADDGTGGMVSAVTPVGGDGTDGGKGASITPLTPVAAVGGGSIPSGDGTSATGATVGTSGKGTALGGTSNLTATGSGDSLFMPTSATGAIVWASGGFALILMMSGWFLRRGELKQAPSRWRRLGL